MSYERPNIARMQGYSWGEQPDDARTLKLNTNENPYPPSPAVRAALQDFDTDRLRRYPQPTADGLRNLIATHFGLQRDQVLITNGGDELLRLAFTTFLSPGQPFATAAPSYSLYPVLAAVADAPVLDIPLDEHWRLPEDFAAQLNRAGAGLCALVNPHAPSGTLTPLAQLEAIAAEFNGVLLIDEAYVDFVEPQAAQETTALLQAHDNILLLRTLSKGYGLAGLRLGWGMGSTTLIEPMLTKTRDSYNINAISQAVAEAAFADQPYARDTWDRVRTERARLQQALAGLGFAMPASQSNFLLAYAPTTGPAAEALYQGLKAHGILVRWFNQPRLQNALRISIGTPEENDRLLAAVSELLG
jgi:histidinol-phosphate aminotransferase